MLADHIVVADHYITVFPFPSEILGSGGNDGSFVDHIVVADPGSRQNADVRADVTFVADLYITVDVSECIDRDVLPDLGFGMDVGKWTDCRHIARF